MWQKIMKKRKESINFLEIPFQKHLHALNTPQHSSNVEGKKLLDGNLGKSIAQIEGKFQEVD